METLNLLAQSSGWGDHMSGWGGGWMWLWGTLMMATWVAIIGAVAWFVIRATRDGHSTGRAREILDERLASGDLTPDEYQSRRDALR